jgi:hypothetical protein
MTHITSLPIAALPKDARRDQWGRYLVVPPGGGKPVGYTRATTVAGTLDSGGGLAPWKAAMTAAGIIMRRGLRAEWEALMALYGSDPWYASQEGKAECKRLVEECAAVGGANDRREMGTALHTITALIDLGHPPAHLTEETERDIQAYTEGLASAGVILLPEVELTVVLDDFGVAGTFDRLAGVPGFALPLIADLKTGAELSYSWQSIAVQLAIYSRANDIYQQGPAEDGSQDVRRPMPEVDQDWGLVIWLNAGTGVLELHLVDLNAGWAAFDRSMWTREWRNTDVSITLADYQTRQQNEGDLVPLLEASIAAVIAQKAQALGEPEPEPEIDVYQATRDWLQDRVNVIGDNPKARAWLMENWPQDLPTLRAFDAHTPEQIDLIDKLLAEAEKRYDLPFGPSRPQAEPPVDGDIARVVSLFPGSTLTNDNGKDNAS